MVLLRELTLPEMDIAAAIHRAARDYSLPWLPRIGTAEQLGAVFRQRVFSSCAMWGAVEQGAIQGFIAFREGWIDHLYVLPQAQRRGLGSALLEVAKRGCPSLHLWTFQRNLPARRFYEAHGFHLVEETDGAGNMEREPDAIYLWSRQ